MDARKTILFAFVVSAASIDPRFAANITVYHVNQGSFGADPVNMNTGDAWGDMYFDLRAVDMPIECAHPTPYNAHDCKNAEVTGNDLVITKLILEVDTSKYGNYGRCNVCVNGSDHHGHNNCTDGTYLCDCSLQYNVSTPCNASIGRSNLTERYASRTCDDEIDCWKLKVARKTGGFWYSTTQEGWCDKSDHDEGKGADACTWRVAEAVKRVNKTCSDDKIYATVEKAAATAAVSTSHGGASESNCFAQCAGGTGAGRNTSDPCWIRCFYDTVLGSNSSNPNITATGMTTADLLASWNLPFVPEAQGGCAALPIPTAGVAAWW